MWNRVPVLYCTSYCSLAQASVSPISLSSPCTPLSSSCRGPQSPVADSVLVTSGHMAGCGEQVSELLPHTSTCTPHHHLSLSLPLTHPHTPPTSPTLSPSLLPQSPSTLSTITLSLQHWRTVCGREEWCSPGPAEERGRGGGRACSGLRWFDVCSGRELWGKVEVSESECLACCSEGSVNKQSVKCM